MHKIKFHVILIMLFIFSFMSPISPLSRAFAKDLNGNAGQTLAVNSENSTFPERHLASAEVPSMKKTSTPPQKMESTKPLMQTDQTKAPVREGRSETEEDMERDIMEEALALLNESQTYWVNGNLEDALEMLDQTYALLLDANGNQDTVRQKDDLRLMISKRILAIYNSIQTTAKGKRSEIPITINANVEKEIRQFQTVERDFFISSYQRSAIYRPIILRELKKAGLPEELSWLPLVESGFKITALSTARALGLWQFIPSTGYKYGLNRDDWVDERMDIEKSTRAAIDYLKDLHNMFGDWLTVLAGYNCGEGRVMRTIAAQHINYLDRFWDLYSQLPYETARYVPRFLATLLIVKDPLKYGMDLGPGSEKTPLLSYEFVEINKCMRLQDIAQKLETPEERLNILNAELRHKITPDKPYKLKVPLEMAEKLLKVVDEIAPLENPRSLSVAGRGVMIRHKVQQGETLASIARKYKTSVGEIRTYNNLSNKQQVAAGRRLNIPIQGSKRIDLASKSQKVENPLRYTVQKGDTLAAIARKYDTTIPEIRKINHLSGDTLKSGQVIRIQRTHDGAGQVGKKEGDKISKVTTNPTQGKSPEVPTAKKYTVKKGDSLNRIARENNIALDRLLELNRHLTLQGNIRPGQVLLLK